jgi:3-hydroxymyristoyl/3-hydroxydecanoyl-(acyl carrier protein) dehydratase
MNNLHLRAQKENPTLQHDASELQSLIAVRPPYFALKQIHKANQTVFAEFNTDFQSTEENSNMSLAEVGRHMAILGSLAVANSNPVKNKHYYLASYGEFERVSKKPYNEQEYKGYMTTVEFNRKKALATGQLMTMDGEVIYEVKVGYSILSSGLFERMFKDQRQETPIPANYNPYHNPITFDNKFITPNFCYATIKNVGIDMCLGHFDNFPALPVARIGGALVALAGYNHNMYLSLGNARYCIRKAIIKAESFVFAGESLSIESEIDKENTHNEIVIQTKASTDKVEDAVTLSCWFY